jgi:predicted MFS family arabinose efflux permease
MSTMQKAGSEFRLYHAAVSGLLAMLVGLGIARFGYAPLVPALITHHWFAASTAFWLGTANLLGYFIGALGMRLWRRRIHTRQAVAALMGITAICLLASAWNGGILYFGLWRLLSGITGGALMVLMAAAVVGRAPPEARGRAGGITFAGMGLGITLTGLLIPKMLAFGLPATWLALGLFAAAAAAIAAWLMPPGTIEPPSAPAGGGAMTKPVILLFIGYSLCALGFVPHMLFMASYVAIGLNRGIPAGAHIAAIMGIAAACGPPILGRFADRYGFLTTLAIGYAVMGLAVALPLLTGNPISLGISAAGVGAVALGAVMLTSGALAGMVHPSRLAATWGLATMTYAIAQAAVAAGFSTLFHATNSYHLLFAIGSIATFTSAGIVATARSIQARRDRAEGK